jgi:hypothetical protein
LNKQWVKSIAAGALAVAVGFGVGTFPTALHTAHASAEFQESMHPDVDKAWTDKQDKVPRIVAEAAGAIGVAPDDLLKKLKQGSSIADVAKGQGISEEQLVQKLMEVRIANLDNAISNGKLTAEQAADIKRRMTDHLTAAIQTKGIPKHKHKHGHHHHQHKEKKEE